MAEARHQPPLDPKSLPFTWSGPPTPITRVLHAKEPRDWADAISRGQVLVHGRYIGVGYVLKTGDPVTWREDVEEPPIDTNWSVIAADSHYLVVDKPARLPVHPTGAYRTHCLTALMEPRWGRVFPIHRLDRETSGILILARHSEAARLGTMALSKSQKTYIAAVHGDTPRRFESDLPLGPKPGSQVRLRQGGWWHGQDCLTRFATVARGPGKSLVMARPVTGRRHQIRAHLAESGFPVVGDKIYGTSEHPFLEFVEGRELTVDGLDRHFLHCWKIRFHHPILGVGRVWKSPLPETLQNAWKHL